MTQAAPAFGQQAVGKPKLLRVAVRSAETGFDPPRVSDEISNLVTRAIFEAPLTFNYLARPSRLKPATVVALRRAAMDETSRTMPGYMPYIPHVHPRLNDLAWPHVRGWVTEPLGDRRFLHTNIV